MGTPFGMIGVVMAGFCGCFRCFACFSRFDGMPPLPPRACSLGMGVVLERFSGFFRCIACFSWAVVRTVMTFGDVAVDVGAGSCSVRIVCIAFSCRGILHRFPMKVS